MRLWYSFPGPDRLQQHLCNPYHATLHVWYRRSKVDPSTEILICSALLFESGGGGAAPPLHAKTAQDMHIQANLPMSYHVVTLSAARRWLSLLLLSCASGSPASGVTMLDTPLRGMKGLTDLHKYMMVASRPHLCPDCSSALFCPTSSRFIFLASTPSTSS